MFSFAGIILRFKQTRYFCLPCEKAVEGVHETPLDGLFLYRWRGAVFPLGEFVVAMPDEGVICAVAVPYFSAVKPATIPADDSAGEG